VTEAQSQPADAALDRAGLHRHADERADREHEQEDLRRAVVWGLSFVIPSGTYDVDPDTGGPIPGTYTEIDIDRSLPHQFYKLWNAPTNGLYGIENEAGNVSVDNSGHGGEHGERGREPERPALLRLLDPVGGRLLDLGHRTRFLVASAV
jgi:hypothetical protein